MDEGQCQSDAPLRRSGAGEAELQSEGSARSPDQNHTHLLEEGEEVEQGPRGGGVIHLDSSHNHHTGEEEEKEEEDEEEDEAYEEGSKVEEEEDEEEIDSNSGAFSPEPDSHIQFSQSPSPTASEGLLSPECVPVGVAVSPGLGQSLGACLCVLQERGDDAMLPLTLHQIAEALVLEGDYQRAICFLQLEKLYHERVLSNIATLQEHWESRWRLIGQYQSSSVCSSDLDAEHLERLRHICRTHRQPTRSSDRCELVAKVQRNSVFSESGGEKKSESERPCSSEELMEEQKIPGDDSGESCSSPVGQQGETETLSSDSSLSHSSSSSSLSATPSLTVRDGPPAGGGAEEDTLTHSPAEELPGTQRPDGPGVEMEGGGASLDTGQDLEPERGEPEEQKGVGDQEKEQEEVEEAVEALELEGGGGQQEPLDLEVPELRVEEEPEEEEGHGVETLERIDTLDDLAKRIQVEEIAPAAGLVSILKRRVSQEGTAGSSTPVPKPSKRKVRFRVPDDGLDHDEVGGDSWLLLLLLCLATVVISVGGTALYCTFGDAQSSVCTDFSHNMDFYVGQVQRGVDELRLWLNHGS
ncbi:consortin [Astyanax mexicanus]|uniref:consortin n=1 Tax=Astyanax mexicanus TaxID=7994 RepID=UPI0020CB3E7B|nr:consortin [Astyanax mexicanus]